jgi:hypothetical protein
MASYLGTSVRIALICCPLAGLGPCRSVSVQVIVTSGLARHCAMTLLQAPTNEPINNHRRTAIASGAPEALIPDLVGGPGLEPGASRSRNMLEPCPRVTWRLPQCPPELDCRHRRVLL